MPTADGRILNEGLLKPASASTATVAASVISSPTPATGLRFEVPTDPTGATADTSLAGGSFSTSLSVKDLTVDGKTYRYFDSARAVRQ
jgi:hypothetical protein